MSIESSHPVKQLISRCHGIALEKGFWDIPDLVDFPYDEYTNLKKMEKVALIMSELGELVESLRNPGRDQHCPEHSSEAIELADAVIRIMDYAGGFGIDLAGAIDAKVVFNVGRSYRHGKKF